MDLVIAPEYTPHDKQLEFHRSNARFRVCAAGVRGGKTLSATVELLRSIYRDLAAGKGKKPAGHGRRRQPRLLYWAVAPTTQLNVHVHRYVNALCPPELIERVYDDAIWLRPDILIEFKTAERPDLLVGASVNGMLIDEACRVKGDAWDGALRGRVADTGGFVLLSTSPTSKNSWVYKRFVAQAGANDIESFSWRTVENTAVPELVADVEQARATMPDAWFRREFEASWDAFAGAVYEFDTAKHVISDAALRLEFGLGAAQWSPSLCQRLFRRVIAGVDWGFNSPGAIVVVGHLGDNRFVVLEESYAAGRQILGHGTTWLSEAKRLKDKYGVSLFACDPARPDAIQDFSTNAIPAVGAFNDVYLGIRRVVEALHPDNGVAGLRICDSAQHLIAELRSYQWETTRDGGSFLETPADGQSDHAVDALRYAIAELRPYASQKKPAYGTGRGPIG